MRFVLAIIAAIANAAGPWLCCCAVGAMLHLTVEAKAEIPKPNKACTHCCPSQPVSDDGPSVPSKPIPTPPSPCQERQLSIGSTGQEFSPVDAIALDFALPVPLATMGHESTPASAWEGGRPFYPPDTRQRVHHVLHC